MSKLAKAIDATLTGNVRASRDLKLRYTDVRIDHQVNHTNPIGTSQQVRIGVKLQADAWVNDFAANVDARSMALRDLKRAMIEEVFGEFRPLIIEMRAALYDEDTTRIRGLLAELETQMFNDGI